MEKVKSFQNLWPKILFYLLEDAIKPRMQHPSGQQKKSARCTARFATVRFTRASYLSIS
jgi:hypothetical protein